MKRFLLSTIIFIFCFFIFSSSWAATEEIAAAGTAEIKVNSNLTVSVDPRIELLSVIKILAGCHEKGHAPFKTEYLKKVFDYFNKHQEHEAVRIFSLLYNSGFSYDAPAHLMVALSQPPEIKFVNQVNEKVRQRAVSDIVLNDFVSQLGDFSKKTDFMKFFKENKNYYDKITAEYKSKTDINKLVGVIEKYYGMSQSSYNIILAPILRRSGGYGVRANALNGKFDVYNVTGPNSAGTNEINFGEAEDIRDLVWHEFSHSFVNPITEKNSYEINLYSSLYKPIEQAMREQAYSNWETCVNEHIIRAITARLTALEISEKAYKEAVNYEKSRGFFYVEPLCELLKKYEDNRRKYTKFEEFYPEITALFKDLSSRDLGPDFFINNFSEVGTINAAGDVSGDSIIIITPSNEKDKNAQAKLIEFIKQYGQMFFKKAPILSDADALKKDLKNNSLIVFGTPSGNLWLAKNFEKIPVKFSENSIELDKSYKGNNLRFITAWPNPQNPKRGVIIYTALKAGDIENINGVMHGPTDYVVADGDKVLVNGNYEKQGTAWSVKK
ncbi:MAG: DUF4932 domain-containing protein [Candidatus Wallbacteria bacterium]